MQPLRLWFNQAYRGTFQLLGMLREGAAADGLTLDVTGTHTARSTPFLQACDTALPEREELTGPAWVEHALEFCAERRIDVFVPGRERLAVAEAEHLFAAAGVRLMVSPAQALRTLGDKQLSHQAAIDMGVPVPLSHVVHDAAGFRSAYDALRALGLDVCLKPVIDHGAKGFRIVDEAAGGWSDLLALPSARIHPDAVERLLAERGRDGVTTPLMVAEYLDGDEVSIDVLSDDGELLAAVPRSKGGAEWTLQLVDDPAAVAIAEQVVKGHRLRFLSNVQVRYGQGTCRLLEVNTRAASGLFHSRHSGVNLPYAALRLLLDGHVTVPAPALGVTVLTYNEAMPVQLPF